MEKMTKDARPSVMRVDANYAVVQSSYWGSYCALAAFTTIYLSYRGLTDAQIGVSTSLMSALAILLQATVSNFCDHHMRLPIKRVISALFLVGICVAGLYANLPMPIGLLVGAYAVTYAVGNCNNGLLNAQLMQFNNVGIPAHYGWPRGCGSICYAALAWVYGILAEQYTPAILPKLYIAGTAVCILAVLLMPDPYKGMDMEQLTGGRTKATSYRAMLQGNTPLMVFLGCVMLYAIGQAASFIFMIRVIERLGGGTAEYGLSEFARAGVEMPMLFLSPLLLKKSNPKALMVFSFICYGLRALAVTFAPTLGWLYAACTLNMFCSGIYVFASVIMVNTMVRMTEKVRAQSLVALFGSIGSIIGNAYGGFMLNILGLTGMMVSASLFCFAAAAVLAVFCHPREGR